jgi:hypothetical protein
MKDFTKKYSIVSIVLTVVFGNLIFLGAADSNTQSGAFGLNEVHYKNKTSSNVYIWEYYGDKDCQSPVDKITVRGDENKAITYLNSQKFIRVTTVDSSCAPSTIRRWVGNKAETIEVP